MLKLIAIIKCLFFLILKEILKSSQVQFVQGADHLHVSQTFYQSLVTEFKCPVPQTISC